MTDDFNWSRCPHNYLCGCPTEGEAHRRWVDDRNSQGKHTVGPKISVYSPTAATTQAVTLRAPPNDHNHWMEEASIVIREINEVDKGPDVASLFGLFDSLRKALDHLKPHGAAIFSFQRDHESSGLIYWDGMYRKWFYLLAPTKSVACTVPEKQYLSIFNPRIRPDALKRNIWVAMNSSLREKVMKSEMTLTEAEAHVR